MDKATEQKLLDAIAQLEKRLEDIEASDDHEEAHNIQELLKSKVDGLAEALAQYVRAYPVRSAAIAFLLGVLIASRRRGR